MGKKKAEVESLALRDEMTGSVYTRFRSRPISGSVVIFMGWVALLGFFRFFSELNVEA